MPLSVDGSQRTSLGIVLYRPPLWRQGVLLFAIADTRKDGPGL